MLWVYWICEKIEVVAITFQKYEGKNGREMVYPCPKCVHTLQEVIVALSWCVAYVQYMFWDVESMLWHNALITWHNAESPHTSTKHTCIKCQVQSLILRHLSAYSVSFYIPFGNMLYSYMVIILFNREQLWGFISYVTKKLPGILHTVSVSNATQAV